MKYKDGYLCGEEELEQLPVEILEDVIIRIHRDSYLSRDSKRDLLKTYLEVRKWKLDKAFQYTEENLRRLREMNELIEKQSIDAIRTTYQVYQDESSYTKGNERGSESSKKQIPALAIVAGAVIIAAAVIIIAAMNH